VVGDFRSGQKKGKYAYKSDAVTVGTSLLATAAYKEWLEEYEGLLSLAADSEQVALLTESGLTVYCRDSGETAVSYPDIPSCQQISLTGDGNIIATARHTAAVYAAKEAE